MLRTYNPLTRRYEADIPAPKLPAKRLPNLHEIQSELRIANAKLTAIAKCSNVKQVKAILG